MKSIIQRLRHPRRIAWLALPAFIVLMSAAGGRAVPAAAQATGTINIQKQLQDPAGNTLFPPATGATTTADPSGFQFVLTNVTAATPIETRVTTGPTGTATANVAPGTYTIQEVTRAGTTLLNVLPGQSFVLVTGGTVPVTVVNRVAGPGAITITKQIVNAAGAPVSPQPTDLSGFQFTVTGPAGFSQMVTTAANGTATLTNLALGTYTVDETTRPAGFEEAGMTVDNAQFPAGTPASFTLSAADPSVAVTASNRQATTATVTVTKQVVDAAGAVVSGADVSGFQFTVTCGTAFTQQQTTAATTGLATFTGVPAGNCTIAEATRAGFTLTSITPAGGTNIVPAGGTGGTFTVAAGQTLALTAQNRQAATTGTVTVTKQIVDAAGAVVSGADVSGFQFTITCGAGATAFTQQQTTAATTGLATFTNVPGGSCTVTETARTGFTLVSVTPAGGTNIGQGGTFTATGGQTTAITVQNRAAAAATRQEALSPGCNNVTLTFPTGTPVTEVVAAISPAPSGQVNIWRYDNRTQRFFGWTSLAGAPVDFTTVERLQPYFICVSTAGTLTEPAI